MAFVSAPDPIADNRLSGLHPDTVDFVARYRVEGSAEPDPFLELGWLGSSPRSMDEWLGSPAHELQYGPLVLGDFDDDYRWGEEDI